MDSQNRKLPILLALGIVVVVTIWMLSGIGREPAAVDPMQAAQREAAAQLPQVRVENMQAEDILRKIVVSARTEPNRIVQLRAETDGAVRSIAAERGAAIKAGAPLLTLDLRDREIRLKEARALVAQRELEYKALQNLKGKQYTSDTQIADALARLESARASEQKIKLEIAYTNIAAPFDAVVQDREVEIGDYVRTGDTVAELVDLDPVIVTGEVNEKDIVHLHVGGPGSATLVDGSELSGKIRYISRVANAATRTFQVELAVPNPDNAVRAGLTAELNLFADTLRVHTLSSALLSLADDGTIGVKVVDDGDIVRFYPVEIVGSSEAGMHVTGLPDSIRLITVGQGFVKAGQRVRPQTLSVTEAGI